MTKDASSVQQAEPVQVVDAGSSGAGVIQPAFEFARPPEGEFEALQALANSLVWQPCTPKYAGEVGPHEYVVRNRTISNDDYVKFMQAVKAYGKVQTYTVTGNKARYLDLGPHRYWHYAIVLNRARHEDVLGLYR
jgi:hypothetical protein